MDAVPLDILGLKPHSKMELLSGYAQVDPITLYSELKIQTQQSFVGEREGGELLVGWLVDVVGDIEMFLLPEATLLPS